MSKCPSCGAEIPEGSLYCVKCGEDVHIVPDFDAELDGTYQEAIEHITSQIEEPGRSDPINSEPTDNKKHHFSFYWVILCILCMLLVVGAVAYFHYSTLPSTRISAAYRAANAGEYDKAIGILKKELSKNTDNIAFMTAMADIYMQKGDLESYEEVLWEIVHAPEATQEQYFATYEELVGFYQQRGEYQEISDFLIASGNEELKEHFSEYVAKKPNSEPAAGYYDLPQLVKLSADSEAEIYYTTDGGNPLTEGELYTMPFLLEEGDYTVAAITKDARGVTGELYTADYHIAMQPPREPRILPVSGTYHELFSITVEEDEEAGGSIVYWWDGITPEDTRLTYTGPISAPLGKRTWHFMRVGENGLSSDVVNRTYNLELMAAVSIEEATQSVLNLYELPEKYRVMPMDPFRNVVGDSYYLFRVYIAGTATDSNETIAGYYAVNIQDGSIWSVDLVDGKVEFTGAAERVKEPEN